MYRFSLAFILTIVLLTLYVAIRPINTDQNNYVPLPSTFPSKHTAINTCHTLTKCDPGIGCTMCGSDYECTPVSADENVVFDGQKVSEGSWCLPKGKRQMTCGTFTGRAVYSKDNGWECACLYPDLFSGPTCNQQLACIAPGGENQPNNKLINKTTGQAWDPSDPDFIPGATTPYDIDANGDPQYVCACDTTSRIKYVGLPGDPYRCHRDPCSQNHTVPMWDKTNLKCDCTTKGDTEGLYAHSNVSKTCVRTPQCNWNNPENKCRCPENQVSQTCSSDTMTRTDGTRPPCPDVPGGSFCNNPCDGYCLNKGIPTISGTNCKCKCTDDGETRISGDRCENTCLKPGTWTFHPDGCCYGGYEAPHAWGDVGTLRYVCNKDPSTSSSCFIAGSKVLMFDGSVKPIETVKAGDEVKSCFSMKPNTVLLKDVVALGDRKLLGFNGIEPFITEDHCIVCPTGSTSTLPERMAFNPGLAQKTKHWSKINSVNKNIMTTSDSNYKSTPISDVVVKNEDPSIPVYDLITKDHTVIVNDVCCFDDMPEIEKFPVISILIAMLLHRVDVIATRTLSRDEIEKVGTTLFDDHICDVLTELVKDERDIFDVFDDKFKWFMGLSGENVNMLHLGSYIWKINFDLMKELEFMCLEKYS